MILPSGRALLDPNKILKEAGLTGGQIYADFGCGTLGHFVIPASAIVGEQGKVYALDILKKALSAVEDRTKAEKIFNLQVVWSDLEHEKGTVEIPESSVDLVSFVNITGLILKNQVVVDNVKRVLKIGGRLVLVDWQPNSILARMLSVHKTDQAKLKQVLEQNGFHLLKSFPAGLNHFGLLFEKGP
ncbi:MAG: methyltransferase domain-containing protein [Candidatus Uhrbacteria bacterium]